MAGPAWRPTNRSGRDPRPPGVRPALPGPVRHHLPAHRCRRRRSPVALGQLRLAISECGASLWCDPARWVPETARLLRPGGQLVFHTTSILVTVCSPGPDGPAGQELIHPQRQAHRMATPRGGIQFHPGHGEWIKILRGSGFVIDALHELYAPPDAPDHSYYALASAGWARRWPAEEIWTAHLAD
jgi:hypothetical protein